MNYFFRKKLTKESTAEMTTAGFSASSSKHKHKQKHRYLVKSSPESFPPESLGKGFLSDHQTVT